MILKNEDEVLLLRRAHEPYRYRWDFPGGFIEPGETLEQAFRREVTEETGLTLAAESPLTYVGAWYDKYTDSTNVFKERDTLNIYFVTTLTEPVTLRPSAEGELAWWRLSRLPSIAFPSSNGEVIQVLKNGVRG